MESSKTTRQGYRSMLEFEKKFFPKSSNKRSSDTSVDSRTVGINLARESLDTLRRELKR